MQFHAQKLHSILPHYRLGICQYYQTNSDSLTLAYKFHAHKLEFNFISTIIIMDSEFCLAGIAAVTDETNALVMHGSFLV